MSNSNTTDLTNPSFFILLGIPGLEEAHIWLSIPFCVMYALAILGNFTILWIIWMESSLHVPMYYFFCMLAVSNLIVSTSTLPKMLSIFWFNSREIEFNACFTQFYFIHCFSVTESGILVALSFDRYVAICDPLRHSAILTNSTVVKISLTVLLRSALLALPFPFLGRRLPYCKTNIIPHTYCDHISVVKLACADIRISNYYGFLLIFFVTCPDLSFITFSYTQILRVVFSLTTDQARHKTFGTCGSHLCVVLIFYLPSVFSFFTHRFGQNVPLYFHILTVQLYLLVPPVLNPIVYVVRTKHIRDKLLQLFTHKAT